MQDIKFNTPFEMSRYIAENEPTAACKKYFGGREPKSHRQNDDGWTTTANYNDADNLFKDGDTDNAQKIVAASIAFDNRNAQRTMRRGMSPAIVGCLPNVPAAIQGLPVAMYHRQPQPAKPIVHLDINNGVSWNIDAENIVRVGAVILSVVNELERNGQSVEITIKCETLHKYERFSTSVTIKNAGQHFNASQLAYCLVNPSFLRRHLFAVWERSVKDKKYFDTYGRVSTSDEKVVQMQTLTEKVQNYGMTDDELINAIKSRLY